MSPTSFACQTRIVSGLGAVSALYNELRTYDVTQPALVVDAGIAKAGLIEKWIPKEVLDISTRIIAPVDPDLDAVATGVDDAKAGDCDGVVVVGGGSAICLGKAIAIMLVNDGNISDYEGDDKVKKLPAPTICLPTTAGAGSEISRVLYLHERGRRQEVIVRQYGTEPRVALLDGNLLINCPHKPLLDAALQAISHACEALWSQNHSMITDALAEKSLETFISRLPAAINDRDPEALQAILEASSAANVACNNTGLALLHALNTAPDVPLPRGYTNGCLLKAIAAFNRPYLNARHQKLIDQIPALFEKIGWQGKFSDGDVDAAKARLLVEGSVDHPARKNNLRASSDEECYKLLRESGAVVA